MKKTIAAGMAILFLLVALAGCSQSKSGKTHGNNDGIDKVYSLSGRNEFIEINNGVIVLTPKLEQFVGGELSFKAEELAGLKDYRAEFFIYIDGVKTVIDSTILSIEGSEEGTGVAPDMGSVSAERMFDSDVWEIIIEPEALHFSLSGTFINGETFVYSIVLTVNEVFSG